MKKLESLHIINGDASLDAFESANFPGQVIIWREILSEGPVIGSLPEEEFWQKRKQYILETYNETTEHYKLKVLDALDKLNIANVFFEVILWFDADLMCQINLLYLLNKLSRLKPAVVSICSPEAGRNIAQFNPEELHRLFENRQVQSQEQLQQAEKVWQLYAGPDPMQLQRYLQAHDILEPYLKYALQLHLQRFPDCENGLGKHETEILRLVKAGATTELLVMEKFWEKHLYNFGFGDMQLVNILKRMQPTLIDPQEPLKLTSLGEAVLNGKKRFKAAPYWLGGVLIDPDKGWCYHTAENLLRPAINLA